MVRNKRKKFSRLRGSHTHGWGSMKKHRGAGNRGGTGMAGSGKRADQKKPSLWGQGRFAGKHGFISKSRAKPKPINVSYIDQNLKKFVSQNMAALEKGAYKIDLEKLGFTKLLGKGRVNNKYVINVASASEKAVRVVEAAGGQVVLTGAAKGKTETEEKKASEEE